ncbi:copper homeostasis protein CutC [Belliella sp. DSM 107340]|uniref:PF03932 family protein CutC n=1 Tax=Belliella calami TaxID=2923436 RepID=A0ABS9UT24_9BACT|nr:copper homeostasis protein CutC [Belliella calami]MCH7399649.1 copper homeostasis protein CutC [Belliella calami]
MDKILLEAPVFTIEAALKAAEFGVDRIELCSDFGEGGETPSVGALAYLKGKINIPIFVMIRPRGGDFVYTPEEIEVMKKDIQILGSYGADGFVFGVLTPDGEVDKNSCKELMKEANGKPCTFHRAFDISVDPEKALEAIIDCGFERLLTSGTRNTLSEGISLVKELLQLAQNRIIIMPGGGLEPGHVESLKKSEFLKEVHGSCKVFRPTDSNFFSQQVQLSKDPNAFKSVLSISKEIVEEFNNELKL